MRHIVTLLLILSSMSCFSQLRIFSGQIDKYPIQMATYSYSDGITRAIYAYNKYDTPIVLDGELKNDSLVLSEKNEKGEVVALIKLQNFNVDNKEIRGQWISQDNQKTLVIRLAKLHEFDSYDATAFDTLEIMQAGSTTENYFRLLISKKEGEDIQVTGVRIYEKKTDRLIQALEMECTFWGLDNISVYDYNFDGIDDFSVFEASYAGPNTSRIYVLREHGSERYYISEISGVSLEFDPGEKLIYEHNQCCAGRSHINATYKLIDNKMALIDQRCLEYNDDKEDFIEVDCD